MNLQNQLSIKSALRFALPGLAACLFLTACSNEVSDFTPEGLPSETVGTVRFTASAPLASEDVATRIGIGEGKPSVDEWTKAEPIVWIGDEEVSVFFVSKANGDEIHARFRIDGAGKSADLVNVTDLNHLNGEYEIYAFTPYVAGNTLSQAQLSLANQSQAANTTDYSHLSKSAYMRAAGGEATFATGSLTSGDVNFHFEHVTSFLRFNITNSLGRDISVTGISVSHPNMITEASYNIKNKSQVTTSSGSAIELSFGASGQPLSADGAFDAYMSTLTVPLSTNINQELELTIYVAGDSDPFVFSVLPGDLDFTASSGMFEPSTRFLFEVNISNNNNVNPNEIIIGNYGLTWDRVNDATTIDWTLPEGIFVTYGKLANCCPTGYQYADLSFMQNIHSYVKNMLSSDAFHLTGFRSYIVYQFWAGGVYIYFAHAGEIWLVSDTEISIAPPVFDKNNISGGFRPLCFRELP